MPLIKNSIPRFIYAACIYIWRCSKASWIFVNKHHSLKDMALHGPKIIKNKPLHRNKTYKSESLKDYFSLQSWNFLLSL